MSDKTEIATRQEAKREIAMRTTGVVLETLEDAYRFSKMVVMAGMAPRGIDKPEKVLIAIQAGAEVGLSPWQAIQSIAIINNRPTMWGDACIGLVQASGLLEDMDSWDEGEGENFIAFVMVKRKGSQRETVRSFGWKDAKAAGLLSKDTYKSYLPRMCFNRARAFALRDVFPDVLKGLSVGEEVEDYRVIDDTPRSPKRVQKSDLLAPPEPELEPSEVIDVEPEPEPEDDYDADTPLQPADDDEVAGLDRFELDDLIASDADAATVRREIDNSRRASFITQAEADALELKLADRKPAKGKKSDALFESDATY